MTIYFTVKKFFYYKMPYYRAFCSLRRKKQKNLKKGETIFFKYRSIITKGARTKPLSEGGVML